MWSHSWAISWFIWINNVHLLPNGVNFDDFHIVQAHIVHRWRHFVSLAREFAASLRIIKLRGAFSIDCLLIFKSCGLFLTSRWMRGRIELIAAVGVPLRFDLLAVCRRCIIMFPLMRWKSRARPLSFMRNVPTRICIVDNSLKLFASPFFGFLSNFVVVNYGFPRVSFSRFPWYDFVSRAWNFCGGIFVWDINISLAETWCNTYFPFGWVCFALRMLSLIMETGGL